MIIVTPEGEAINFDTISIIRAEGRHVAIIVTLESMAARLFGHQPSPWSIADYRSNKIARAVVGEIIAAYEHGARVYRLPNNNYSPKEV